MMKQYKNHGLQIFSKIQLQKISQWMILMLSFLNSIYKAVHIFFCKRKKIFKVFLLWTSSSSYSPIPNPLLCVEVTSSSIRWTTFTTTYIQQKQNILLWPQLPTYDEIIYKNSQVFLLSMVMFKQTFGRNFSDYIIFLCYIILFLWF